MTVTMKPVQPNHLRREAVAGGLKLRCLRDAGMTQDRIDKHLPLAERGFDGEFEVDDFGNMHLLELGRQFLMSYGIERQKAYGLGNEKLARILMGERSDPAYHITDDFTELTLDAFNKTLLASYAEAQATWSSVFRQGESVDDFKDVNEVRMGAIQNLPVWPDNTDPHVESLSEEKTTYAVEARALEISFSWQLMVNDDTQAIANMPFDLGRAAVRTVNAVAWRQITSNPQQGDGQALYLETPAGNRKQGNLITGSASPTVSSVGLMKAKMRLFRAINTRGGGESDAILNIEPAVIAGPAAIEGSIDQLLFSTADPATNLSSAVHNPFTGLTKVIEPLLDANSSTAFYLFADPNVMPVGQVIFLKGQEEPMVNNFVDKRSLSQHYTVVQTFGVKASEFRGSVKHDGV